jgi:hypothetical protein
LFDAASASQAFVIDTSVSLRSSATSFKGGFSICRIETKRGEGEWSHWTIVSYYAHYGGQKYLRH